MNFSQGWAGLGWLGLAGLGWAGLASRKFGEKGEKSDFFDFFEIFLKKVQLVMQFLKKNKKKCS